MFTPTRRLFQQALACRITLFTRDGCGLCVRGKSALSAVWDKRPFDFTEVEITKPEFKRWKDLYYFDVPVIHISKAEAPEEDPDPRVVGKAVKLMHRFDPDQIEAKMDQVEGK